jgi:GTPase
MPTATICPIFPVSSVTKQGFGILIDFISKLNVNTPPIDQLKDMPF